jgi:hypothetical protein
VDSSCLSSAFEIFTRFGRCRLVKEPDLFFIVIEQVRPCQLSTNDMSSLQNSGWYWNCWTNRWEVKLDQV